MKQRTEEVDHPVCIRCNRKLKSPEARLRGMGDVCWKKYQQEQAKKKLFQDVGMKVHKDTVDNVILK